MTTASNPSLPLSFLAGSAAHFLETATLGYVLDRITVQQQVLHLRTTREAVQSVYQKGGWKEFYQGLRWSLLSSAIKGAGGWGIHNFCNRNITAFFPQENPSFPSFKLTTLVACTTAAAETTLFLCPLERLKVLEMTYDRSQRFEVVKSIREGGLRFIYRGWSLMIFQKSWSWMNYLGVYQQLRHGMLESNQQQPLTTAQKLVLGWGTGGLVACFNAPLDLLKTQKQKYASLEGDKVFSLARSVFKEHGWQGMFRGLKMKVARTAWSTGVVMFVLDNFNALPQNMKV